MTDADHRVRVHATRTVADLRQDQLDGIAAWQESARQRELAEDVPHENREAGTESRRRLEALRRTNVAVLSRAESAVPDVDAIARAVVVHRLEWMRDQLAVGLRSHSIEVVATEHDGADGLGVTIAEQPDLLVVERRLASVPAEDLVRSLRRFAPNTVVAAQVEHDSDADVMLAAGAAAVFSRRVPPSTVCARLAELLLDRPDEPLLLV